MLGVYLTDDDDRFADVITDELDKYNSAPQSPSCVSFYPWQRGALMIESGRFCVF